MRSPGLGFGRRLSSPRGTRFVALSIARRGRWLASRPSRALQLVEWPSTSKTIRLRSSGSQLVRYATIQCVASDAAMVELILQFCTFRTLSSRLLT